jgi:hypothetical protein
MIQGLLTINLDPSYISFLQTTEYADEDHSRLESFRHCSLDEIRNLLIALEALTPEQTWPLRECVLRLHLNLPLSALISLGLARSNNKSSIQSRGKRRIKRAHPMS